jgi:glycerate-2-kinase
VIISNKAELLSHGRVEERKQVLEIMEAGLAKTDPYDNARRLLHIHDGQLWIGHPDFSMQGPENELLGTQPLSFELSQIGEIYVVGGGKAAQRMAKAIEDVLGSRISAGCICAKKGEQPDLRHIELVLAGHPIPDEDSLEGAQKIYDIEQQARRGDIVFVAESGGGTALMTLPGPGLCLQDIQDVTRKLYFECGATITETNIVRSHLVILRGRHSRNVRDATLIRFYTDPMPPGLQDRGYVRQYFGRRGYQGAVDVLKQYQLWNQVSPAVRSYLLTADPQYSSIRPGELRERPQYHFRVKGPEDMLEAARSRAEALGIQGAIIASSPDDIEAQAFGRALALQAIEIEMYQRPFKPPCVLIAGGELLVRTEGAAGLGGRNQEFVLAAATKIHSSQQIVIASADSDGTDGPTDIAGGIVDGLTMTRAVELGIKLRDELKQHNSMSVLQRLRDGIMTGAQGTNVQDLRVIYIGQASLE